MKCHQINRFWNWIKGAYLCPFCHKVCSKIIYSHWNCDPCQAAYYMDQDNQIITTRLSTNIQNRYYHVYVNQKYGTQIHSCETIGSGLPGQSSYPTRKILEIPSPISITPHNIQQKLKTLLLFS